MRSFALLALCAAATALDAAPAQAPAEAVAREVRARAWALEPAAHRAALAAAAGAADWSERFLALDALSRAVACADEDWRCAAPALGDEHPNVRGAALLVLAHAAQGVGVEALGQLVSAPAPATRGPEESRTLVACLRMRADELRGSAALVAALERLAAHDSARVATAAREALWVLGPRDATPHVVAAQLRSLLADGRPSAERLLAAAPLLLRAGFDPGLARGLRATLPAGEPRALVEGLALRAGLDADRDALVEGWLAGGDTDTARASFLDALAQVGDERLGAQLLDAARALDGDARALQLVASASEALPPGDMARAALELPGDLAAEAWRVLALREHVWTARQLEPWLALEHDDALRFDVASIAADAWLRRGGEAALGDLLARLVRDRDAGLRIAAFRWLCDAPDFAARAAALHSEWSRLPLDARLERLRDLPRDGALGPFRDELVGLARDPLTRTESVVGLLGGFSDDEVVGLLSDLLQEAGRELAFARDEPAYRRIEGDARVLARSVARAAPARTGDLEAAIEAQLAHPAPARADGGRGWELAKTCAALLARTASGRARLATYLRDDVPRRLQVEAALGLVRHGGAAEHPGLDVHLTLHFDELDSTLRVRVLEALGHVPDTDDVFLSALAEKAGLPLEERLAAVASLGRLGEGNTLSSLLLHCVQHEVRLSTIEALARLDGDGSRATLRAFREVFRERGEVTEMLPEDGDAALALDRALLALGAYEPAYLDDALARPAAAAAGDLAARFRGARLPDVTFRWRAELELASDLAGAGLLADALARQGDWWGLDARFLQALAERVRGREASRALALRLFEAARVGLAGEAHVEGDAGRVERILLAQLALAEELEDWDAFIACADRLYDRALVRAGRLRSLEEALGVTDPGAGVDPLAQIASARWQARAWRALGAGDAQVARDHAARAARALGASRRARAAQDRLEAAFER